MLHAQVDQSLNIIICLIMVTVPPTNFRMSVVTVSTYSGIEIPNDKVNVMSLKLL